MSGGDPRVFGNYEILSVLGRGGMAEVFRARVRSGPLEGRQVALKRLLPELARDPEQVERFTRESNLSQLLDHPNVIRVIESGVHEGVSFMVMELVDGRDLGQVLKRCRARGIFLPLDVALFLGRSLLDALAHAHGLCGPDGRSLALVHCDISPSNLFISRTGEIKLGDFGVARVRMGGNSAELQGKPYYVSPEVLGGEITREADLWAATVTLYELLTLERPFSGRSAEEVYQAIRERRYPPPASIRPDFPEPLAEIIARAFSCHRSERFQSAREFAWALEPLFDVNVGTPLAIAAVVRALFDASPPAVSKAE